MNFKNTIKNSAALLLSSVTVFSSIDSTVLFAKNSALMKNAPEETNYSFIEESNVIKLR